MKWLSLLDGVQFTLLRFRFGGSRKMSKPWAHFTAEEVAGLESELVAKLDRARQIAGVPFIISSGLRQPGENSVLKGAVPDSAHLTGKAVDLKVGNSHDYYRMMLGLLDSGFKRIGQYLSADGTDVIHLHVDIDDGKPQEVIFSKREQN